MHLDTHVVVWLYIGHVGAFSPTARRLIEDEPLAISPMVALELDLLFEIGRTEAPSGVVLNSLESTLGLSVSPTPFSTVTGVATDLTWTRDPFDRLICAQAVVERQLLVTKDRKIHANLPLARWD